MKKTVAFFGDSFVAAKHGWIEKFSIDHNYDIVHLGKSGADVYFPIQDFLRFCEKDNDQITDLCIYAHTDPIRLYHSRRDAALVPGVFEEVARMTAEEKIKHNFKSPVYFDDNFTNAVGNHFKYITDLSILELQYKVIVSGVDRILYEYRHKFKKIIHLWSFGPPGSEHVARGEPYWSPMLVDLRSGINILLDLHRACKTEPSGINVVGRDVRLNHFGPPAYQFMTDLIYYASISDHNIDFRPFISGASKWEDYINTLYNHIIPKIHNNKKNDSSR